jgi:hypothetical protein
MACWKPGTASPYLHPMIVSLKFIRTWCRLFVLLAAFLLVKIPCRRLAVLIAISLLG